LKLTWQDVDAEQGTVHFPESGHAAERTMTIPPKLMDVLKALPRIRSILKTPPHIFQRVETPVTGR